MIILQAQTDTDLEDRTVVIHDIRVTNALFPSLDEATQQKMRSMSEDLLPKEAVPISLDRMLAAAEDQAPSGKISALKSVAPTIFVSTEPSILLLVDGEAVKAPIPQSSLEIIVNANWDLFFDTVGRRFYLSQAPLWLQAPALEWSLDTRHDSAAGYGEVARRMGRGEEIDSARAFRRTHGRPEFSIATAPRSSSPSTVSRSGQPSRERIWPTPPTPTVISSSTTRRIVSTT